MDNTDLSIWKLITGELHNELTSEEEEDFNKSMMDKENYSLYQQLKLIHEGLETAQMQKKQQVESWHSIKNHIHRESVSLIARNILKYAAVILISFLSGFLVYSVFNSAPSDQYAEVNVENGQTCHLTLFDGTEVWLNSGTSFKYPGKFNTNSRNVYLNGEAFFKVTKNKSFPFKVNTGRMQVEVLGTSFNVSAYQNDADQSVVLVEGKVRLNNVKGKWLCEIDPGQIAVRSANGKINVKKTDTAFYTGWKSGKIVFNSETISDIVKKIERWYNIQVQFENEKLKNFRLSGTILLSKPVDQVFKALEMLAPVHFTTSREGDCSAPRFITVQEKIK